MLDIKYIRSETQVVKQAIKAKNIDLNLDELLKLSEELRSAKNQLEDLQKQKNQNAKHFQSASSEEEKQKIVQAGRKLANQISTLQSELNKKQTQFQSLMLLVPNIPSEDSPVGKDSSANKVIKVQGASESELAKKFQQKN